MQPQHPVKQQTGEVLSNGLIIEKKWISENVPGFNKSMCVVIKKSV